MTTTPQDVYAKYLQHPVYGYPLWMPETMSNLPDEYQKNGLQIGDIGIIHHTGQFNVLFNVCKKGGNVLHTHGVPENFQPIQVQANNVNFNRNAISPGPIFSDGIYWVNHDRTNTADYEFVLRTPAGAILILPYGATSEELLVTEDFRNVATENALHWYQFAQKRYPELHSLYLITGLSKARSWSLGSFSNPTSPIRDSEIHARRDNNIYRLEAFSRADCRNSSSDASTGNPNQTVFITGFRITVRSWLPDPVVLRVTESETTWSILLRLFKSCFDRLRRASGDHKQPTTISVEHSPQLSQPFHPSEIINRFLLNKNPNARIAITHDNQWMDMMKGGLTHVDLLQSDRLETFLTRGYTMSIESERENVAVFLRAKTDDSGGSPEVDPLDSSSEPEVSDAPTPELELSPPPTPDLHDSLHPTRSHDDPQILITRIRAQNIATDLKRHPVGFYVLVQLDDIERKTQIKSVLMNDSVIDWEDEILLPSKPFDKVRFTAYASFELEPMLGSGEALYTSEARVEDLVSGTYLSRFSPGGSQAASPDPSLLITLGRWRSDRPPISTGYDDSNMNSEESLLLVRVTDSGHEALRRYHSEYHEEDLQQSVQHFERAWHSCPLTHQYRAAVLVNLAKAKFISYQIDPTDADIEEPILLYRQALDLRRRGHPDRPATLLQLAQTLLHRYEKQGCNESVADGIVELMDELQVLPEESHERRAAHLVIETLKRCRVVNSGSLAELDELARRFKQSTMIPPGSYFDRPQRIINLSTTLWRRYEKIGALNDLDQSIELSKHALLLLRDRHPEKLPCLKILSGAFQRRFEIRGDLSDIQDSTAISEAALQIISERHPERPDWIAGLRSCRARVLECLGDTAFNDEKYDEAVTQYSRAIEIITSPS